MSALMQQRNLVVRQQAQPSDQVAPGQRRYGRAQYGGREQHPRRQADERQRQEQQIRRGGGGASRRIAPWDRQRDPVNRPPGAECQDEGQGRCQPHGDDGAPQAKALD